MKRNYYDEINDDIEFLESQTYYHGTSTSVPIRDGILRPSMETNYIREQLLRHVYVTTSYGSAKRYAYKAVEKFGGDPVVYVVKPDIDTLIRRIDNEYICDFAEIIE